jgi:hypothetical protein
LRLIRRREKKATLMHGFGLRSTNGELKEVLCFFQKNYHGRIVERTLKRSDTMSSSSGCKIQKSAVGSSNTPFVGGSSSQVAFKDEISIKSHKSVGAVVCCPVPGIRSVWEVFGGIFLIVGTL